MNDRAALARQLPEQRQRDDALAAARPSAHNDDPLAIIGMAALHCVEYELVGQSLLCQQGELFAILDLLRGYGKELPAGSDCARQEPIRRCSARRRREVVAEVVEELAPPLGGEQPTAFVLSQAVQVLDPLVGGVVQIDGALNGAVATR